MVFQHGYFRDCASLRRAACLAASLDKSPLQKIEEDIHNGYHSIGLLYRLRSNGKIYGIDIQVL